MKAKYLKPDATKIDFEIEEPIMEIFDGSFEVGEDDDEGI